MITLCQVSSEVSRCIDQKFTITDEEVDYCISKAKNSSKNLHRICLHESDSSNLQQMLIAVTGWTQYPIHRHPWKLESYIIMHGKARYHAYDDAGKNTYTSEELKYGEVFFNRVGEEFHGLIPLTQNLVFLESTHGPFKPNKLEFLES